MNHYAENLVEAYRRGNSQQSVNIGFQIPIFQWGINKNKIKIAKNEHHIKQLTIDTQIKDFENEIKVRVDNYNKSVSLWHISERAYILSQTQYRMLVHKFSLGKVSVYELTTAQRDQGNAMGRYYSSMRDTYIEYFALRHLALYDLKSERNLEEILINGELL